jgi:interferon gamma-inducible protein 30
MKLLAGIAASLMLTEHALAESSYPRVNIKAYTESLWPYCIDFITGDATRALKAFGAGNSSIMEIALFPYGNAQESSNGDGTYSYQCQHGPDECTVNMLEVCAMHFHPHVGDYMPFVECVENSYYPTSAGESCASQVGWSDWSEIDQCTSSRLGNKLQHKVAEETNNLQPPHQFTPWITLNGVPLTSEQQNESLIQVVCNAYTGPSPPACNNAALANATSYKKKGVTFKA